MDSVSKTSSSSGSLSLTELSDALQGEDTQGRKVLDISSDASLQQQREKVTRAILAKPSLAMKLRTVTSLPLAESDQYIKKIDSAKTPDSQQKAVECFVDVLFKENLTDDSRDGIRKCINSTQLTPGKFAADHMSFPEFGHTDDEEDGASDNLPKFECVYLKNTSFTWRASPLVVSNESRLAAINAVTDWVYQNYHSFNDKPLTLVSLGSGFLLMEHLIHQKLLEMGVPEDKIQWRCIDTRYTKTMMDDKGNFEFGSRAMKEFENNKKGCVEFFSTEKNYFNQTSNINFSTSDKEQGPVALLSFVPHCINESSGLMPHNTKDDIFVGTVVRDSDLKYANSVCLISADPGERGSTMLRKMYKPASCHQNINNVIMKAWIGRKGTPEISFGYDLRCQRGLAYSITSVFLTAFNSNHSEITPLEKLKYAFDKVCFEYDLSNSASCLIFPFTDYFISLNNLHRFFFNAGTEVTNDYPVVLCELILNEVKMTKKNDVGEAKGATSS